MRLDDQLEEVEKLYRAKKLTEKAEKKEAVSKSPNASANAEMHRLTVVAIEREIQRRHEEMHEYIDRQNAKARDSK